MEGDFTNQMNQTTNKYQMFCDCVLKSCDYENMQCFIF